MKRFYNEVSVDLSAENGSGWCVALDGRAIRTPAGQPQIVPTQALASAMAEEWAGQNEEIDPAAFGLRDLADYVLDSVRSQRDTLVPEIAAYAQTDTLCYRADEGDALHNRQMAIWEPLLLAAEARWDARFVRISGIMHRPQPAETLGRMRAAVEQHDEFALAALHMLASLSASLVIALAALEPDADADSLWQAANLEEDWQAEKWGLDTEAEQARNIRFEAFAMAIRFARLARS